MLDIKENSESFKEPDVFFGILIACIHSKLCTVENDFVKYSHNVKKNHGYN